MSQTDQATAKRPKRRWITNIFLAGSVLFISALVCTGSYLVIQTMPVFYGTSTPPSSVKSRITWNQLPVPLVVNPELKTWTSAANVTDAVWTGDLIWLATQGGVVVQNLVNGETVKFLPEHGVPSVEISTITTDLIGRIWIGTQESGVAVYDGHAWARFNKESGLPSDRIRDLYVAKDGVIWAATASGLARFDGSRWSAVRFSLFDFSPADITGVTGIGRFIWVSSHEGVYRFDGNRWDYFGLAEGVINDDVTSITITPDRNIWVGTPSGIGRFDGTTWSRYTVRDGLPDLPVKKIMAAPDNSVWITLGKDEEPETAQTVRFDKLAVYPAYTGPVNNLVQHAGQPWLATPKGLLQPANGSILETIEIGSDFDHHQLTDLIKTKEAITIAGDSGVSIFNLALDEASSIESWTSVQIDMDQVNALSIADDGRLALAGTHPADGVLLVDETGKQESISCSTAGMQVGNLYAMDETAEGNLWFLGTENVGFLSLPDGRWEYFSDGLPSDYSPRKVVVDQNGEVWVGLAEGLYRLDRLAKRWELIRNWPIQRMTASRTGTLWLVADSVLLHLVNEAFIPIQLPMVEGISRGFVANEAGLWVSSANGVAHLPAGENNDWVVYTTADGLSTNDVSTLTVDPNGIVWAGYGDARFGFSYFENGQWKIVHNIKDPTLQNGGHQAIDGPRRDEVVGLGVTADGEVWFGSYFGEIGRVAADELLHKPDDYRLYFANMTAIHVAADKTIWFAGWDGRLARLIPANKSREEQWLIYDRELATAKVQDVVVQDGKVWLGTNVGVVVIDHKEKTGCRIIEHRETLDVVAGVASPDGKTIWWATANHGGIQLDMTAETLDWPILHLRGRKFTGLTQAADDSLLFVSNHELVRIDGLDRQVTALNDLGEIFAVATGNDLRPWVATDRGVATIRGDEWQYLTTADGLASNRVIDILIETNGALWVMSETAVTRIRR